MKTAAQVAVLASAAMLAIASASGQRYARPSVQTPVIGKMLDAQGALRTVAGVAGNFLTGPAGNRGVVNFACSAQGCATSQKEAVLAVSGKHAVAYLPQSNVFVEWRTGGRVDAPAPLAWNPLQPGDEVLSLRPTADGAEIAVRRGGAVWVVTQDGAIVDALPPDAAGAVLLLDSGAIYARADALALRRSDGSEIRFPLAGVQGLYRMSPDWVEAVTGGAPCAVRVTPGQESWYALPGGPR